MANQVSGLAGYNTYVKNPDGTYTRNNTALLADLAQYTFTGLLPNTDYSGLLFWTAVDKAGNESAKHAYTAGLPVMTLNPTPADTPMGTADVAAIDALVAKCIAAGAGPGVTIAITSPKGFLIKSYGDGSTHNNDHYRIASQTKCFTGTAVLRAIDAGLISLTDHLSQYLPGYAVDPTIQNMLMMRSGIYDYELNSSLATNFTLTPTTAMSVDSIISTIKSGGKMFDPDTAYYYTNSNYYVLAKVVEAVDPTHRTIDQIIKQDIFTPLSLLDTSFQLAIGTPPAPYAVEYDHNPIAAIFGLVIMRDVSSQNPSYIWAAGAIDSVITDMIKWGKELRDSTLLSSTIANLRRTTFSQQPAAPTYGLNHRGPATFGYGLGFLQVGSWFGHDGSWLGCDSCTMFEPATGTVISVYENFQTTSPNPLAALTTVWYEIADYLYPNSANQPGYLSGATATGTISASMKKMTTDATGAVYAVGSFQPFNELYTPAGLASITGKARPSGCNGVKVSIIGTGGPGGTGGGNINQSGGSGGGSAAVIKQVNIPVSQLASTYDAVWAPPTNAGTDPGDTYFKSGSIELHAGGGKKGASTATYQASVAGGLGGTASVVGLTGVAAFNGLKGGASNMNGGSPGLSDLVNDLPGSGGGGGGNTNAGSPGAKGGDSNTQAGGAHGSPGHSPANVAAPPPLLPGAGAGGGDGAPAYGYNGYNGAKGGNYGAGGSGGGCTWGGGPGAGEPGGDPAILLEWY